MNGYHLGVEALGIGLACGNTAGRTLQERQGIGAVELAGEKPERNGASQDMVTQVFAEAGARLQHLAQRIRIDDVLEIDRAQQPVRVEAQMCLKRRLGLGDQRGREDECGRRGTGRRVVLVGRFAGGEEDRAEYLAGELRVLREAIHEIEQLLDHVGRPSRPRNPRAYTEIDSTRWEYTLKSTGTGWAGQNPAYVVQTRERSREKVAGGTWRYTDEKTVPNADGLPETINDYGQDGVTTDNSCTTIKYARKHRLRSVAGQLPVRGGEVLRRRPRRRDLGW
jgi:hypothetical protein